MLCVSRKIFLFAALLACVILGHPAGAAAQSHPLKLVVGLLPGESRETVLRLNEPLRVYLQQRLNLPVELMVGETYAATGEALRFGRIDIAYLGPITYLLRSRSAKLEAFARPSHEGVGPFFKAVIIVPADQQRQDACRSQGHGHRFRRQGFNVGHLGAAPSTPGGGPCRRARLHAAGHGRPR